MAKSRLDLFEAEEAGLFPAAPVVFYPDPDRIRRRLARILGEARPAETMPWSENRLRLYRQVVPRMALSLPEPEAQQVRLEFEAELARLG